MELRAFLFCFILALIVTPLVIKLALLVGATDHPNGRKVHKKPMPRLGGLAVYLSVVLGVIVYMPDDPLVFPILLGATIIVCTGIIDDIVNLKPLYKLMGQGTAAFIVIASGIQIEFINLPDQTVIDFQFWSIPITLLWIVGVTNSINLVDGLDGLAAGISSIALLTISGMAIMVGNEFVMLIGLMMLGGTLAFLVFNFYPAKIFMGDTGAMFLGFMISVLSLLGFKNVTLFSLVIPILILGVPISDTIIAMVRRTMQRKPIMKADFSHLHHNLLKLGYSHPQTVVVIYTLSALFCLSAVLFSQATLINSLVVVVLLVFTLEIIVEITEVAGEKYRPILKRIESQQSKE
ncbi:glycosyltransferase family 4 protein [Halobacillus sp. Marseille-Q1614]|uniref:glycosyltransferase family 4 protein n=1 Tax=Halobacillus sp. Marseille-Q1614 TaxID=2709134 RepID=UPI00156F50D5|nr:MraY family glycosyltransferase [Halobacillus sp. Marseille-Q1614]